MSDTQITSVINTPSNEIATRSFVASNYLPKVADADVDFGVYGLTLNDLNISGQTASRIAGFDASKNVISLDTATYPSLAELIHLKGVTSAVQTQLNAKADTSSLNISDWDTAYGWGDHASAGYWLADGSSTATGNWDLGSYNITAENIVLNTGIFDTAGSPAQSIDTNNRILYASDGTTAVLNFDSTSGLYGGSGPNCFLDLAVGKLISYGGTPYDSIDWVNRIAYESDGVTVAIDWSGTYPFGVYINTLQTDNIFGVSGSLVQFGSAGDVDIIARDIESTTTFKVNGTSGFTGTGAYTNFTIEGGIITNAS